MKKTGRQKQDTLRKDRTPRSRRAKNGPQVPVLRSRPQNLHQLRLDVEQRLRLGRFDEALFEMADALYEATRNGNLRDRDVLKDRTLVCEIRDYRGRTRSAQESVAEGDAVLEELRRGPAPNDSGRALRREQVRFAADYIRVFFYRERKYAPARDHLKFCVEHIESAVKQDTFPCHGTLAQLNYYLGCSHRQLGEYREAEACYGRAIEHFRRRAEYVSERAAHPDDPHLQADLAYARYRTALCLGLGLGWVNYTRGDLTKALVNNVQPAQLLLLGSQDPINGAYLSLIRGSIGRCQAGGSLHGLKAARDHVEKAYQIFRGGPYEHPAYKVRAAFELALNYLYARDYDRAGKLAAVVENTAHRHGDSMWMCNARIVQSRVARATGDYTAARRFAAQALRFGKRQEELIGKIDAYIAVGEAYLALGKPGPARHAFEKARIAAQPTHPSRSGASNPKIAAVISIHLARSAVASGDISGAQEHLGEWHRLKHMIEHQTVRDMALVTDAELARSDRDYVILRDITDLTYDRYHDGLRRWLIEKARRKDGSRKMRIAGRLGIARGTLSSWLKALDVEIGQDDDDLPRKKQ